QTVADYFFTDTIRGYFTSIFDKVERQKGQAFWVRAQYGGGKTHFLATLAALLSASDEVWDRVSDAEIIAWRRQLANTRLFPVVFSLRGKGAASADVAESLYDIFEDEVKRAAEERLHIPLRLSTEDEVLAWWSELAGGIRAELNGWVSQRLGRTADDLRGSPVEFKEAVLLAAEAHHIRVPLRGRTEQRLRAAFDQVVNPRTGYTGLLVIVDEFAFWQDQHPENSPAAARDEEFLETLGWSLPKTADLPIYTIVASQRRQPAKLLAGQNEGRFISVEISSARDAAGELWEYEQIVSHRVRELDPERVPEIEEYFQDSARRFEFAASLDLHRFRVLFPVEPTCYEILQRITESLAAERVGINVLWEVLGEESEGGPSVRRGLLDRRRLITAPDLLASPSLRAALTEPAHHDRFKILEVARDGLQHFSDLDDDECGLAERLVDTLFLWDLAFLRAPKPMAVETLAGAVLAEAGMYNDASEAVDSVLQVIKDLEQIEFDAGQGTVQFVARAQIGRSAQQIFEEFRRRPLTETQIESAWRSSLLDRQLDQNGLTALFSGLTVGQADKQLVIWEQVEYEGRQVVLDYWRGDYGADLGRDDGFFRVVFLLRPENLDSSALHGDRIAVCVPREVAETERNALQDLLALNDLDTTYRDRTDDEALRVKEYVRSNRNGRVAELLRRQHEQYRYGRIVTRSGLNVDPVAVFSRPQQRDRLAHLVSALFEHAFPNRPFADFRGNAPLTQNAGAQQVFEGLFKKQAPKKAIDAVLNFGTGLGLTTSADAKAFNADQALALQSLRDWFQSARANGENLPAWQVYDRFAALGVPTRVATLYLLAFVRRPSEGADLILKQGARVTVTGVPGPVTRLTSALIPHLEWTSQVADGQAFDALAPRTVVDWGTALDWLRLVEPDLKATNSPEEIEEQADRALAATRKFAEATTSARDTLTRLAQTLDQTAPHQYVDALAAIARLGEVESYSDLYERAQDLSDRRREEFAGVVAAARAAVDLVPPALAIQDAVRYLRDLDGRLDGDLEFERANLLRQLTLPALLAGGWPRLEASFAAFRGRYRTQYQKFHRDRVAEVTAVAAEHAGLAPRLTALERLDQIEQLGMPVGAGLRARWQQAGMGLAPCDVPVSAVTVEEAPVCSVCQAPYGEPAPADRVRSLGAEIVQELEEKTRVLRGLLLEKLQQQSSDDLAGQLAHAITIGSDALVETLVNTEAAVPLIQRLLQTTTVRRSRALHRLRDEFPTFQAATLDAVVARFRALLVEEFDAAGSGEVELRFD
ncbi:MAG: hypothetical protein HY329_22610, partial [Chloroflexi bacterium]|nr:hypothetical protein [Chloroflexota bacterium]